MQYKTIYSIDDNYGIVRHRVCGQRQRADYLAMRQARTRASREARRRHPVGNQRRQDEVGDRDRSPIPKR